MSTTRHTTGIEWTHVPGTIGATWNPVVGCSIVSPGCTNCYAMPMARRIQAMTPDGKASHYAGTTKLVKGGKPVWTGKVVLAPKRILAEPYARKKPHTFFVNSMGDLFHEDVPDGWIAYVWYVMYDNPHHTFIVLTKRAARMHDWVQRWCDLTGDDDVMTFKGVRGPDAVRAAHQSGRGQLFAAYLDTLLELEGGAVPDGAAWPTFDWMQGSKYWPGVLPNVWLGVSAERQQEADERVPELLATPAAVRFVSAEPLLAGIDFTRIRCQHGCTPPDYCNRCHPDGGSPTGTFDSMQMGLDWIIVGGESGRDARPMHPDWVRSIRDQCAAADVPFFFKQWGEWEVANAENGRRNNYSGHKMPEAGKKFTWLGTDGRTANPSAHDVGAPAYAMAKVGKRRTGNTLDGRQHIAWPQFATGQLSVAAQ